MIRKTLLNIAGAALIAVAVWFVADAILTNATRLRLEVTTPDWRFWAGAAGAVGMVALSPVLWWSVLRGIGVDLPLSRLLGIWWVTNLGKYIPGKAWMVAGRAALARDHGKGRILESFVWEFVANAAGAALVAPLLLLDDHWRPFWPMAALAWAAAALPIVSPRLAQRLIQAPMRWLGRGRFVGGQHMDRLAAARSVLLGALVWLGWGGIHILLVRGVGLDVAWWALTGAFAVAWVLGYAAIVMPAGLGVREGALVLLLSPLMVAGGAALFALVSRTAILVAEGLMGAAGLLMWRRLSAPPPSVPMASAGAGDTPGTRQEGPG